MQNNTKIEVMYTVDAPWGPLHVIETSTGACYIPLKAVIQNIGLNWPTQAAKLKKKHYEFDWASIPFECPDGSTVDMLCIGILDLQEFLDTIDPKNVPAKVRPRLIRYQKDCAEMLNGAFVFGLYGCVSGITVSQDAPLFERIKALYPDPTRIDGK